MSRLGPVKWTKIVALTSPRFDSGIAPPIFQLDMRKARYIVWVHPSDCVPPHGLDMSSEHDAGKVAWLRQQFETSGFDRRFPALVGYPIDGKLQLLSGTHRHEAARQSDMLIPVSVWLRSDVEEIWGTNLWPTVIKDIPVCELESAPVTEGARRSPYEAVDLEVIS